MSDNIKSKLPPVILSAAVLLLDQLTKCLVVKYIPQLTVFSDDGIIEVFGDYLRLIHVRNNAIAFSLGTNLPPLMRGVFFAIMPLLIIVGAYTVYFRNNEFTPLQRWCICGILGGGLGNLLDRFFRPQGVVDFVDCYFFGIFGMERWPTFNFADMCIVIFGIIFALTFASQIISDMRARKNE